MKLGIQKETRSRETRVAAAPQTIKKLIKKGLAVLIETSAGTSAGFSDQDYKDVGAEIVDSYKDVYQCDIIFAVHRPEKERVGSIKEGTLWISLMEPFNDDGTFETMALQKVNVVSLESLPRTSRAQSMDVLSSQANIAGYRAVLEAASHYKRFFPMMMTSAGMAKPAKTCVLGAGVAGLQAIATAKRLGSAVEAFDVRDVVKEQVESLGAKFIELDLGEEGSGEGGYAKALSEEAQKKQQKLLAEKLQGFDIIISTALIPGRPAPVLILPEAVENMRHGAVIIDMAAANGGNCPLSKPDEIVVHNDVSIIGETNFAALLPADASFFFGNNLFNLLVIMLQDEDGLKLNLDMEDDIIEASLIVHDGQVRLNKS